MGILGFLEFVGFNGSEFERVSSENDFKDLGPKQNLHPLRG